MRIGLVVSIVAMSWAACHAVPDPSDPARQQRIDDCLKQCPGGDPEPINNAYPPAPSEKTDSRSSCERRCHSIP